MIRILKEELLEDFHFEQASTGSEVLEKIKTHTYDLIILDITLPDKSGLDILKALKDQGRKIPVLVMSMYPEDQYGMRVLKAGAAGYITKDSPPENIVEAVQRILQGKKYVSESMAEQLIVGLDVDSEKNVHELMSDREFQVLVLIASGKTVSEIAAELNLSVPTISTYRARILDKLRMKTNAELTRYAIQLGLA